MIHSTDLETPERGLSLETREEPEPEKPGRKRLDPPELREARAAAATAREEAAGLRDELRGLRSRIAAARKIKPRGSQLHCGRCFDSGRDEAIGAIEGPGKG